MTIKIELEFIPVAERLPEKEGSYLCFYSEGGPAFAWFPSSSFSSVVRAVDDPACKVTHWAELPDFSKASEQKPNFHTVIPVSTKEFENEMEAFAKSYKYRTKSVASEPVDTTKEILEEIEADQENMRRRREVFLQVALASPQFGHPSWSQKLTSELAEEILKAADKFARGEL